MIDKKFWEMVSDSWKKKDDGIAIPNIPGSGVELIDPTVAKASAEIDGEIDDILADLGLDDDF